MNVLVRRRITPWGVVISVTIVIMAIASFLFVNRFNVAADNDTSKRLITVHDRGEKKIFLSNAGTIGEALEDVGIEVDKRDAVEPSLSEDMVAPEYQVNIYRARPVVVIDGQVKQRVITPYQTVAQIAEDADISLRAEDNAELKRSEDIVTDGAGLQLVIDRATQITLDLYGTTSTILTQGETVEEVLAEKGIELGEDDRVSPGPKQSVTADMNIRVWREGIQTVTKEEAINFEVKRIYDIDRAVGYKDIKVKGQKGVRSVTYEINIKDGQEISRKQIAALITKQPVTQEEVVGVGGGAKTTASENEAIAWQFFIDQGFSVEQTAGIMGNLAQEHGFNTSDVAGGLGIAQWLGGRRAALLERENPFSIYTQLEYIMYEFKNKEYRAYNAVKAATTVEQATIAFQNHYERCGLCNEPRRIQFAYSLLARYG